MIGPPIVSVGPTVRFSSVHRLRGLFTAGRFPHALLASGPPSSSVRSTASRPLYSWTVPAARKLLEQCLEVASHGAAQQVKVVAAFQQADHPAGRVRIRNAQDFFRHLGEIAVFQHQIS